MEKISSVDEYLKGFPPEVREKLGLLRETIQKYAPEAKEVISYQMPAYKQNGILVCFAGHKNHIGFYPGVAAIELFKSRMTFYKLSKGTIQFPLDQPLPLDLIADIVTFKVLEKSQKVKKR
jgi:uncharacterized protein YdhG (YjbR/CyaY superfamily)